MRTLAVGGLALTALMQVVFLATGSDRPFPYREIQGLAIAGSLAAAFGVSRLDAASGRAWLAIGMGVNALMRLAQIAMGLSRLPLVLNLALLAGYAAATAIAILWNVGSAPSAQPPRMRLAMWLLAGAYFLSLLTALSRLAASFGLALGAAGFALAAPNLRG